MKKKREKNRARDEGNKSKNKRKKERESGRPGTEVKMCISLYSQKNIIFEHIKWNIQNIPNGSVVWIVAAVDVDARRFSNVLSSMKKWNFCQGEKCWANYI